MPLIRDDNSKPKDKDEEPKVSSNKGAPAPKDDNKKDETKPAKK